MSWIHSISIANNDQKLSRRTAAKLQMKDRATKAHFGKQRIVQRAIGRPLELSISLAHARPQTTAKYTAVPVKPSTILAQPASSSPPKTKKRKSALLTALQDLDRK